MTTATQRIPAIEGDALSHLLAGYSVEVTAHDDRSLGMAADLLPAGAEVFIANLPREGSDALIRAAARLRRAGLVPVPHLVARKIGGPAELDALLRRLTREAEVDRVLALGGDRDHPVGQFDSSLQLIETGAFEAHGLRQVAIACYPEGHPRIGEQALRDALAGKLAALGQRGLDARLVSQFAFEPEPVLAFARRLRSAGMAAPLRVGVAGPARRAALVRYAMRCGVGASLRALTERKHLVSSLFGGETPEELLSAIALACRTDPSLGIEGVHFFTFGAPGKSIEWAQSRRQ